jgi:UDP-2,3-diacylglucosamine pyrophosphatase LpxH
MRVIVISDLHIGCGPLEDFDVEIEQALVEFCAEVAADARSTEFVINGDFLDFVQAAPWQSPDLESESPDGVPLCFTEAQSLQKLENIFHAHQPTFYALALLVASNSIRRLTIMPGNHDADIFWPKVRSKLQERLSPAGGPASDKISFHLENEYHPPGFPGLWIEHGHQHDTCNSFAVRDIPYWSSGCPPIMKDKNKVERLIECVGTRFMLKFMNGLDEKYTFVDNVKPFSKFVKMFLVSEFAPGFGPLKALAAYWALLRFMAGRLAKQPGDLLSEEEAPSKLGEDLKRRLAAMTIYEIERLERRLQRDGFDTKGHPILSYIEIEEDGAELLLDFLSRHPDILDEVEADDIGMLSAGEKGFLTLGGGFIANETEALEDAARKLVAAGLATGVIMGHTHEAVEAHAKLGYVNTGCWTRYFRATPGKQPHSWKLLEKSAYQNFPYELAYAEIFADDPGSLARKVFFPK